MRLPFFDQPVRAGDCSVDLTLGQVSPHLVHSGKTHEVARKDAALEAGQGSFQRCHGTGCQHMHLARQIALQRRLGERRADQPSWIAFLIASGASL